MAKTFFGDVKAGAGVTALIETSDADGTTVLGTFTTDVIGTTAIDGYIKILVDGTVRKIPFWNDD